MRCTLTGLVLAVLLVLGVLPAAATEHASGPTVEISEPIVTYDNGWNPLARGTVSVEWTVVNTGAAPVILDQQVDLAGLWGRGRGSVDRSFAAHDLASGASETFTITQAAWPTLSIEATVTARAREAGAAVTSEQDAQANAAAIPRPQILLGVGVVLALFVVRRWRAEMAASRRPARWETPV